MKERKEFEFRLFFKYLFMYLCIAVAFILLLIPIYVTMYQVTKTNVIENESETVFENTAVLDTKIEKITTISMHIKNDSNFLRLSSIGKDPGANEYFYFTQAQERLNELRQKYDLDLYAYVLFRNNDIFISESKVSPDYKNIFDTYLKYESMDAALLRKEALDTGKEIEFIPIQNIAYLNGESVNGMTCIYKAKKYNNVDFAMIYTIDMSTLLRSLGLKDGGDEFLQITDREGEVLFNYNYDGPAIQLEGYDIQNYHLKGENYTLIPAQTEYGNLNIIQGIKSTVFDEKIMDVLRVIQTYIILAILLALTLSLLMSFKQFNGISQILKVIRIKPETMKGKNEYKYIFSSVKNLSDENKRYEADIVAIRDSLKNRLVEKMFMQGIYTEKEKMEFSKYTDLRVEFFRVISFYFLWESNEVNTDQAFAEQYGQIFYYIKRQMDNRPDQTLSINYGVNEIIVLMLLNENERTGSQEIYTSMQNIVCEIIELFGQPIMIGISNVGYGLDNVHTCYLQSKRAIRQINDPFGTPVSMPLECAEDTDVLGELNIEQQLSELIMAGEKDAVGLLFQRINRHIKKVTFSSEQDIMQAFFMIRSPILNVKKKVIKDEREVDIPDYNDSYSVSRLLELLEQSALALSDYCLQKKKQSEASVGAAVLAYLNEQYINPDLCAAMTAEKFSLSEKYIFRIVKEETGMPFGKYVENIRMQKAQKLLQETELSAAEISEKIGFNSITTFYKAFNRKVGMAPIAWRELKK